VEAENHIVDKASLQRSSFWHHFKDGSWRSLVGESVVPAPVVPPPDPPGPSIIGRRVENVPTIVTEPSGPELRIVEKATIVREEGQSVVIEEPDGTEHTVKTSMAQKYLSEVAVTVSLSDASEKFMEVLRRFTASAKLSGTEVDVSELRAIVAACDLPESIVAQMGALEPSSPMFTCVANMAASELSRRVAVYVGTLPSSAEGVGRALKTSGRPVVIVPDATPPKPVESSKHPIAESMCALAAEKSVCDAFLRNSVMFTVKEKERREYVSENVYRMKGALERWLKARGVSVASIVAKSVSIGKITDSEEMLEMLNEYEEMPLLAVDNNSMESGKNTSGSASDISKVGEALRDALASGRNAEV
jgi:hypothetical protein